MPSTIIAAPFTGLTTVGAAAIQVQTTPTLPLLPQTLVWGVLLTAALANTGVVYIAFSQAACVAGGGTSGVVNANGYQFGAGASLFIPKTMIRNLTQLWAIASGSGQSLYWVGQ